MKLKPKTVADCVFGWNIMFSGNKSDAEKAFIANKMYSHFMPIFSDEMFKNAAYLVEKETNFFPTIKQIMDLKESAEQKTEIQLISDPSVKRLTEETGNITQEEIDINLQRIEIIKNMLIGSLSMEDAQKKQESLRNYAKK
jgi:hypothetical protein